MKSAKRILAGLLAAIMVLSTVQLPADTVFAEELTAVQETTTGEESVAKEEAPQQESGQTQGDGETEQEPEKEAPGEEETQQPGTGTAEDASGENEKPGEDDPVQTETPTDEETPSNQETEEPTDQLPAEGEETEQPEDQLPAEGEETEESEDRLPVEGEETETPKEDIGDEGGETDTELPFSDVQISGNDLQVSGNDLMSVEESEVWVELEIEGAYQFGDAPAEDDGATAYAVSAYSDEEIMDYLYQQMKARVQTIDVTQYDILRDNIGSVFGGVLNEHPDLYFVSKTGCGFSVNSNTGMVTQLVVEYNTGLDDAKWQRGVDAALAVVDENMTELQKAIALHDYLTLNCEYDKDRLDQHAVPDISHSTYGVFAERIAVCDGYALSYKYLLSRVGINCYMVTSNEINHAWNLIELGGQYYQVDVTWDDPTRDRIGRAVHTYMFRSDANFDPVNANDKHSGGRVTYGSQTVEYRATDTRYDNAFWVDVTSPLVFSGSDCYYIAFDGKAVLKKGSLGNTIDAGEKILDIGIWPSWENSNSYWQGAYSGLFRIGDRMYFNDKTNIYSVAMDGTDRKTEFTPDTTEGYIYGSALCQGKVFYTLHQSPKLSAREELLTADIEAVGTEPEPPIEETKGWNLDNLSAQYTAVDDTMLSSAAAGKPKLLIFYSNGCTNCRNTIEGISGRIGNFAGIDIYAIESTKKSKDEVAAYQQEHGCEEMMFSYDEGSGNENSMWAYARAAGLGNNISWPVICYIDENNRLQYVTTSFFSADQVLYNLKEYCGLSLGELEFYKITYILDGGTNDSANPSIYTRETENFYLWPAFREGYQFGGWYKDAGFTQKVSFVMKGSTGDITIYAKWTPEVSDITIERPARTTYKVGEKIDVTGGKVIYPKNGTAAEIDMTTQMLSGFDSSKPGISTVMVTVDGYTASFDTLIVEEPELTGAYGQSLSTVLLPQNDHGTYAWQDSAQVMNRVGTQFFEAAFTPNDTEKFQQLTDLQIAVTVQSSLEDSFEVTLKGSTFIYNGEEHTPKAVVSAPNPDSSEKRIVLVEGQDYELSYKNNRNAGTALAVVTGKNLYSGSVSKSFEIQSATVRILAKDKVILVNDPISAVGKYEYEISGLVGTDQLLVKPSFSCGIKSTAAPGRYDIVPSGADAGANYTIVYENGTLTVAREYVSYMVTFDVQGHGTAPEAQIGLRAGDTAVRPEDPTAAGYRFDGWYRDAACTKAWNFETDIVQEDMTLYAKWLEESKEDGGFAFQEIADVYYTGKACKPAVTVYDGDTLLKSGRDYQIKYYNNTNANKGGVLKRGNGEGVNFNPELPYVEIIGKGDYTDKIKDGEKDTVKVNFNILRASIGDGAGKPAAGVTLKVSEQLAVANKVQKPFSSIKYVKSMKRDVDFRLKLTVENARDGLGNSLERDAELTNAEIPKAYEGEFLLTVEGIGNYEGSISRRIYVADKTHLMKNVKITLGSNLKNVEYTGEAIRLTPSEESTKDTFIVKYGKSVLKPGRDYTVQPVPGKVGKAELVVTGNGQYVGTKTATFNIKGKTFSAKTVQVSGVENQAYTGRTLTQNHAVLTYGVGDEAATTLQYGTDYTISYAKNRDKGTATMTFKGKNEAGYSGSFKKTFKITAVDIANQNEVKRADTMNNMSFPYCKAGVRPVDEIRLTNAEGFVLQNGKDYTLKYKNNKAVADGSAEKPPTVTVQGKGNYTGNFDVTFQITKSGLKQAVDSGSIQVKTTAVSYNPNKAEDFEYKPAVKLMDGKSALRLNQDYEVRYECNTQAQYMQYWEAYSEAVKNGAADPELNQNLQQLRPRAVITAKAESSYEADGEIVVPLPIYQTKLVKSNLEVELTEAVYTGNQVTPAVTVRDAVSGNVYTEGKDYTVSYGANNKSGKNKGSVTITGLAPEYGGSVTVKFDIVKKVIHY